MSELEDMLLLLMMMTRMLWSLCIVLCTIVIKIVQHGVPTSCTRWRLPFGERKSSLFVCDLSNDIKHGEGPQIYICNLLWLSLGRSHLQMSSGLEISRDLQLPFCFCWRIVRRPIWAIEFGHKKGTKKDKKVHVRMLQINLFVYTRHSISFFCTMFWRFQEFRKSSLAFCLRKSIFL